MAKVTVTFEDINEGVSVQVESDPPFPGPAASQEQKDSLTDAQQMGIRMTHLLTEEMAALHQCSEGCSHDHDHDDVQVESQTEI